MNKSERKRFDDLYRKHLRALKLQGMSDKTIDAYSRAVRRIAAWFDCCPDRLEREQLATIIHQYRSELQQRYDEQLLPRFPCLSNDFHDFHSLILGMHITFELTGASLTGVPVERPVMRY